MLQQNTMNHLYRLFDEELNLCECGNPEDAYNLIRHLLELAPFYEHPERVTEAAGGPGAAHLILSMLTNADLIEHGGAIGGSWITPKGAWFRDVLRDIDNWENFTDNRPGIPDLHGGEKCTAACWNAPTV